jgi:hypothetical protein
MFSDYSRGPAMCICRADADSPRTRSETVVEARPSDGPHEGSPMIFTCWPVRSSPCDTGECVAEYFVARPTKPSIRYAWTRAAYGSLAVANSSAIAASLATEQRYSIRGCRPRVRVLLRRGSPLRIFQDVGDSLASAGPTVRRCGRPARLRSIGFVTKMAVKLNHSPGASPNGTLPKRMC